MRTAIGVVWMLLVAGQSLAADSTPNLIDQCRTAVRLSAPARPPGVDTKDYIDASLCVGYLSGYGAVFLG
jgi:hypothetical protein